MLACLRRHAIQNGELTVLEFNVTLLLAVEDTSLTGSCTFLAVLGIGAGFGFLGATSSFAAETRRLDRRGSSAGIPSSRSFAFLLAMLLVRLNACWRSRRTNMLLCVTSLGALGRCSRGLGLRINLTRDLLAYHSTPCTPPLNTKRKSDLSFPCKPQSLEE